MENTTPHPAVNVGTMALSWVLTWAGGLDKIATIISIAYTIIAGTITVLGWLDKRKNKGK